MKSTAIQEYFNVVFRRAIPITLGFTLGFFLFSLLLRALFPAHFHLDLGSPISTLILVVGFAILVSIPISLIAMLVYRAETKKLRESEARYRHLFENNPHPMWVYDVDTLAFLAVNEVATVKYGYTREEFLRMALKDIIVKDAAEPGLDGVRRLRHQRKDKTILDVEIASSDIPFEGRASRLVSIEDVTEKNKIQIQLLRAQRMESIGTLAGGIAHDLNNVLAPIVMGIDVLASRLTGEKDQRILKTMEECANRGTAIVRQVLTFARGAEGERFPIQPRDLVLNMEKMLRETFPKSIAIDVSAPEDLWMISGDSTQLDQVLLNLCINARDAMRDGGRLSLRLENRQVDDHYAHLNLESKPGPYVVLEVTDSGEGIPPQAFDKIFEPFFTTKEVGKGTGLGLSTARAIVKSHGGFVNVYTDVGKGTSFKVFLPALESSGVVAEKLPAAPLPTGKKEIILVVDDEAPIRHLAKAILESFNYEVLTAADGAEAVASYAQRRQDIAVVLLDMMMPVMDGPATIRVLERISPDVKIIASSGLVDSSQRPSNFEMTKSVKAVLAKPYTADKLMTTLVDVIQSETRAQSHTA